VTTYLRPNHYLSLLALAAALTSHLQAGTLDLTIAERWSAPIREVSALALKDDVLYLASDDAQDLLKIPKSPGASYGLDVATSTGLSLSASGKKKLSRKSQWEALTFDPNGSLFALKETKNEIYQFSARGEGKRVYSLAVWDGRKKKDKGFEGLLLLKNGHMLLAQTKPGALVEYGPKGDSPLGLRPLFFPNDKESENGSGSGREKEKVKTIEKEKEKLKGSENQPFDEARAAASSELVPLQAWLLEDPAGCQPSDLALDVDGSLLILLKDCFHILRIKTLNLAKKSFVADDSYRIPEEIEHAEGLVAIGSHGFLVAVDQKDTKNNLFRLHLKKPLGPEIRAKENEQPSEREIEKGKKIESKDKPNHTDPE